MQISELNIIVSVLAVVFVFLFGVTKFSRQMQYLAGDRLKGILEHFTKTPFRGLVAGTVATSIFQSSTVVTVMLVSLVHAGLIPFRGALGVIFGANIGTALSTSIIAFRVLDLAPYILVAGFLLMKIKGKYQRFGKPLFYLGFILSSLFLISVLVEPLKESALFMGLIGHTSNVIVAVVVGAILTTILQSSTVVSGMVIILAGQGILGLMPAFGIILGSNIGTTTTALIASSLLEKSAKRAAVAHFLFNCIGVIVTLPFVSFAVHLISNIPTDVAKQVAIWHFLFNIIFAVLFLILIKPFAKLVEKVVP